MKITIAILFLASSLSLVKSLQPLRIRIINRGPAVGFGQKYVSDGHGGYTYTDSQSHSSTTHTVNGNGYHQSTHNDNGHITHNYEVIGNGLPDHYEGHEGGHDGEFGGDEHFSHHGETSIGGHDHYEDTHFEGGNHHPGIIY